MQAQTIRVVLVDDSAVIRRLLTEGMASDLEIEIVAAAHHGAEAVEALAACRPDVVLLDSEMPVMNGVKAVVEIRKLNPQIPIIMLTTTDDPREVKRCYDLGCASYVTKPVDYEKFVEAIRRLGLFLSIVEVPREDAKA